jgi:acyl carrier protein
MTMNADTEKIRGLVAEHARLRVDVATLDDDEDLFQAGMTSHASVNLMLALEDEFGIEFPQATLRRATFRSVAAMAQAVRNVTEGDRLSEAAATP